MASGCGVYKHHPWIMIKESSQAQQTCCKMFMASHREFFRFECWGHHVATLSHFGKPWKKLAKTWLWKTNLQQRFTLFCLSWFHSKVECASNSRVGLPMRVMFRGFPDTMNMKRKALSPSLEKFLFGLDIQWVALPTSKPNCNKICAKAVGVNPEPSCGELAPNVGKMTSSSQVQMMFVFLSEKKSSHGERTCIHRNITFMEDIPAMTWEPKLVKTI